jgi:tetratricopeptide (TPR) repeat protein
LFRTLAITVAVGCAWGQSSDYDQGVTRFERGDVAGAIPFLVRAAEAHPKDPQTLKALGVAYAAQKLYAQAEPPLQRACELDRTLPDACYFYARVLYGLDRFDRSLQILTALPQKPAKIHLAMAQAMDGMGKAAAAESEFHPSLALTRGSDPSPAVAFGLFLIRQGRFPEARTTLEDVLRRFPNAAEAHLLLGRALLEDGNAPDAAAHLERALVLTPNSGQAHLLLAKCYVRMGRAAEAQPHFEAAAQLEMEK